MNFSKALKALKKGKLVAREEWYGDLCIYLVSNETVTFARKDGYELEFPACIYMSDGKMSPDPYYPTQTDILAEDWIEVELED